MREGAAFLVVDAHFSFGQVAASWAFERLLQKAKDCGCAVILDIDYRPVLWGLTDAGDGESRFVASEQVTRTLQPFLSQLDLIIGTEEEVIIAGGSESLEKALEKISAL